MTETVSSPVQPALMTVPILTTKLYAPPARPNLVVRPRLRQKLEQALSPGVKLILVSAPAGFGKTTLVADWGKRLAGSPAHAEVKLAWLSLDEADNDPARFLTYLVSSLQRLDPTLGPNLAQLSPLPKVESVVAQFVNNLMAFVSPVVLVLDDYHLIQTEFIHQFVERLLDQLPPQHHLALTTREDPSLPLPRLRARGQMVEVRQDDLRFSLEEATDFLNRTMGLALTIEAVAALETRTEGWIAGLQLAALSLQGRDAHRVADFIEAFSGSHRYVIDYLVEEVLNQQPADIRHFLRQTSILERLSGLLCNAVTGRSDSRQILSQLEQVNLFLIPLDDRREWYRYHHLFAEFLKTELSASTRQSLHQKAAVWLAEHQFLAEAIGHAVAAQATELAADLIEQAADGTLRRGEFFTLNDWFEALPPDLIHARPNLALFRAWVDWTQGRVQAVDDLVHSLEAKLPAEVPRSLQGRLNCLKACLAIVHGRADGLGLAQLALEQLADADLFFKGMTLLVLGEAQNYLGDSLEASQTFEAVYELGRRNGDLMMMIGGLSNLTDQLTLQGRRRQAAHICRQMIEEFVDEKGQPLPLTGFAYLALGLTLYHANKLDEAKRAIDRGAALGLKAGLIGVEIYIALARAPLLQALGEFEAALRDAKALQRATIEGQFDVYVAFAAAFEANLHLKQGNLAVAKAWAQSFDATVPPLLTGIKEAELLVYVRYLLAVARPEPALSLLVQLEPIATRRRRSLSLMTVYILQAVAQEALGQRDLALNCLARAIELAAPETYRRVFLDEGPAVGRLLLHVRSAVPDFVRSLLEAFGLPSPVEPGPGPAGASVSRETGEPELIEPLSEREVEVLQLVADGLSNREIAASLIISVGTVKKHLNNIFGKLEVRSRTQAVAQAREVGLVK